MFRLTLLNPKGLRKLVCLSILAVFILSGLAQGQEVSPVKKDKRKATGRSSRDFQKVDSSLKKVVESKNKALQISEFTSTEENPSDLEGKFIQGMGKAVYLIKDGKRYALPNEETYVALGGGNSLKG